MRFSPARKTLLGAATAAVALTGVLATAPTAGAVGSSACTRNDKDRTMHTNAAGLLGSTAVHTGPAGKYKIKGAVTRDQDSFRMTCSTVNGSGHRWYYGTVRTPNAADFKGWVYGKYMQ